jgi:hypothetical protein
MILEGIVTTLGPDGTVNVAPMGPRVDVAMNRFELKPFRTARTYANLKYHGEGVFHVTDDVLLLARSAVGDLDPPPRLFPADRIAGRVLSDACRYYEFRVLRCDDGSERVTFEVEVVHSGRLRDFFGFNRAKHAVVEAAILATRTAILPAEQIAAEFARLTLLVQKTGGEQERQAFAFLEDYVRRAPGRGEAAPSS